jgi:hypothetical protein
VQLVHFGLAAKHPLATALARLQEEGREAVGEGIAHFCTKETTPPPRFASPSHR